MSVIVTGIDMPKNCVDCRKESTQNVVGIDCSWLDNKNCPLKSIDGLIERIEKAKGVFNQHGEQASLEATGLQYAIELIKEYCEVQDADSN